MIRLMALLLLTLSCGQGPAAPSPADSAVVSPPDAGGSMRWPQWRPFWL